MIQVKKRTYLISLSLAAGLALSQLTGCASSGPEETTAAWAKEQHTTTKAMRKQITFFIQDTPFRFYKLFSTCPLY